ncbi:MAG TPA: DUF3857 and transglutaminase domain-containing protein, partial [Acidobacteriota bacterium]|nr:DUF3857 and transglutaminase domain-containing protein [Acidobacteriota bacterium]
MRHRPRLPLAPALAALFVLRLALPALGQKDWPPISAEEMALKDCPQQPGAPAVFLYREQLTNHNDFSASVHYRLKILTPAGKERANIEIPFNKGSYKIQGLKARVVQPDGRIVDFKGEVFEKTAVRAGRAKTVVKAFALPDVDVGSIIDYRFKIVLDSGGVSSKRSIDALEDMVGVQGRPWEGGYDSETGPLFWLVDVWDIQEELFTLKAKFAYTPSEFLNEVLSYSGTSMRLNWVTQRLQGVKPEVKEGTFQLEMTNVPAFEAEEFMAPKSTSRMEVRLFYIEGSIDAPDKYWAKESANWQKGAEKYMRKAGQAEAEAKAVTAGLDDPMKKLRALYDRAQAIKNLSYDKSLTRRRRAELKIKDNGNVGDVFKHGYGWRSDITRAFTAMARAVGFEARVVRVSSRDDKFFVKHFCGLYDQFDTELAMVKVGGEDKLFDPATPFCPIGMIPWRCS